MYGLDQPHDPGQFAPAHAFVVARRLRHRRKLIDGRLQLLGHRSPARCSPSARRPARPTRRRCSRRRPACRRCPAPAARAPRRRAAPARRCAARASMALFDEGTVSALSGMRSVQRGAVFRVGRLHAAERRRFRNPVCRPSATRRARPRSARGGSAGRDADRSRRSPQTTTRCRSPSPRRAVGSI